MCGGLVYGDRRTTGRGTWVWRRKRRKEGWAASGREMIKRLGRVGVLGAGRGAGGTRGADAGELEARGGWAVGRWWDARGGTLGWLETKRGV